MAFRHAIELINFRSTQFKFKPKLFNISRTDSFKAQQIGESKKFTQNLVKFFEMFDLILVCSLAAEGVDAIFGPNSVETSGIVSSICEQFEIPHVIFHWKTKSMHWRKSPQKSMTVNLYPDSDSLSEAFSDVLVDFDWQSYTIIYETKENLIRLKDILQIHQPESHSSEVIVEQLDENYAIFLKKIRQNGASNIVLDISTEKIIPFLTEAAKVNMLTEYTNYFITNLDTHTLDLSGIPEIGSNITCLRIVNPRSDELLNALRVWRQRKSDLNMTERQVPLEAGLVHDAVQVYYNALQLYGDETQKYIRTKHSCDETRRSKSKHGFGLAEFIKTQEFDGVTGQVEFNNIEPHHGSRTQFRLEVLELTNGKFTKIGFWDTTNKLKNDREQTYSQQQIEKIQNKKFKIVVKLGKPFLMQREVSVIID